MRFAITLFTLGILFASLLTIGGAATSQQQPVKTVPSDIQKLEEQFKEIDKDPGSVTVEVAGDKESSGTLRISVRTQAMKVATAETATTEANVAWSKDTVFQIDLSEMAVSDEFINARVALATAAKSTGEVPEVKMQLIDNAGTYELVEDYTYPATGGYRITAPKGFRYDRASIPRIFWVLIDKDSVSNVAPLFHDLLYRNGGGLPANLVTPYRRFSRLEADDLFLEIMTKRQVKPWRRKAAYRAVREFAALAWKSN